VTKKEIILGILKNWHLEGRKEISIVQLEIETRKQLQTFGLGWITGESVTRYCRFCKEFYLKREIPFYLESVRKGVFAFKNGETQGKLFQNLI